VTKATPSVEYWEPLSHRLSITTQRTLIPTSTYEVIQISVISGFFLEVDENCALLGYAVSIGNLFLRFRDNLSVPSSGVKNS